MVFLGVLVSGLNSEDIPSWIGHIRLKLPFLILPFAFFYFRKEVFKEYYYYLFAFFCISIFSVFPVLFSYLSNIDANNQLLGIGQSIDTPVDHIKYSLFISFGALIGVINLILSSAVFKKYKSIVAVGTIILIFTLHLLAVRSGLLVFYLSMFAFLIKSLFSDGMNKKVTTALLLGLFIFPLIAVNTLPSLKNKIAYMKHDLKMYAQGKGLDYSDSERIYSYMTGWDLFKSDPIMGTGIGDLLQECKTHSKSHFGKTIEKYPHNQFLFTLSGMGILGFLMFFLPIIYPLWKFRKNLEPCFFVFNILIFSSFMVENTIQRSYSTAFFLFFYLIGLCYLWETAQKKVTR